MRSCLRASFQASCKLLIASGPATDEFIALDEPSDGGERLFDGFSITHNILCAMGCFFSFRIIQCLVTLVLGHVPCVEQKSSFMLQVHWRADIGAWTQWFVVARWHLVGQSLRMQDSAQADHSTSCHVHRCEELLDPPHSFLEELARCFHWNSEVTPQHVDTSARRARATRATLVLRCRGIMTFFVRL